MSIERTDIIDFASLDKYGNAVLTISDHLEWDEGNKHLLLLQEKINSYLTAIESGELFEQYPVARDKKIAIELVLKYWPSLDGEKFLGMVQKYLSDSGYQFYYKKLIDKSSEDHSSN
jgi:hypothetical protein